MNHYYPAFLDLRARRCVVIGAGEVAERKARQLAAAEADVTVVAPDATPWVAAQAAAGALRWEQRSYAPGDLRDAFLAVAATADSAVNEQVRAEATVEKTLLNVVDAPDLCNFIAPAVVERGPVTVAISTNGTSPALARKLRELMAGDQRLDDEACRCLQWADAAELLGAVRAELRSQGHAASPEAWQEAMDAGVLELVQSGKQDAARQRLLSQLKVDSSPKSRGR